MVFLVLVLGVIGFSAPRIIPAILSWWKPNIIFRAEHPKKTIYLTIDDSPTAATEKILAVLAKHKVSATFFIISGRVKSETDLNDIVSAGNSLGHHMRTTKRCSRLEWAEFISDFDTTDALIRRYDRAAYFRPPSDFGTEQQLSYAKQKGYTPILGTIFPLDHWIERPWILSGLLRWLTIPGGILIMHDGDIKAARTAEILETYIPAMKDAGYEFALLPTPLKSAFSP